MMSKFLQDCAGAYATHDGATGSFTPIPVPNYEDLPRLAHTIASRVSRFLERRALLERDAENSYLVAGDLEEGPLGQLIGHSIAYRIAMGPHQGRKVFTLQTLPSYEADSSLSDRVAKVAGFSLHAGVAARAHERNKLEKLWRYNTHPAVSEQRLSLTSNGNVRYQLKTLYSDGTSHVIFDPLDFLARLAVPLHKPHGNLTRYHGVFARISKDRARITPAGRSKGRGQSEAGEDKTPIECHAAMTWAQRLKRIFNIDITIYV